MRRASRPSPDRRPRRRASAPAALEGLHDDLRARIVDGGRFYAEAERCEVLLEGAHALAGRASRQDRAGSVGGGRRPQADPFGRQPFPRKPLARIYLAAGRDVGMGEDTLGANGSAGHDVAAQSDRCVDLRVREGR